MKKSLLMVAAFLVCAMAHAQVIFNQDFDGGYGGAFATSFYQGGSPSGANYVSTGLGNPNGGWYVGMSVTTWGDYYAGQLQLMTVPSISDPVGANYTLSFDVRSKFGAGNLQLGIQSWQDNYFGGAMIGNATVNQMLAGADQWQTFNVNIGSLSGFVPTGATWQLNFQLNAWEWNGPGNFPTINVDNVRVTHVPEPGMLPLVGLGFVTLFGLRRRDV